MVARRRIAGLLALCVLALSYSEALTAGACSMDTSADMAMDMPMPMPAPAEQDDSEAPQPDCPLSMPGSPGNCVFSSALVPATEATPAQFAHAVATATAEGAHYQLLLTHSAFHPPKA